MLSDTHAVRGSLEDVCGVTVCVQVGSRAGLCTRALPEAPRAGGGAVAVVTERKDLWPSHICVCDVYSFSEKSNVSSPPASAGPQPLRWLSRWMQLSKGVEAAQPPPGHHLAPLSLFP